MRGRSSGVAAACALLLVPIAAVAEARAPLQKLDVNELAKQTKTVVIDKDELREVLATGTPTFVDLSAAIDLGDGAIAIAWSECSESRCRGWAGTLTGAAGQRILVKKVALVAPAKVFSIHGFAFEAPAFTDLDGDGSPEIILHYRAEQPPRRAVGSLSHEYVVAYSPKDLSLVFSHELAYSGVESEDSCYWTLDRSGDRLIASAECNLGMCLRSPPEQGCKPTRKLLETWRKPRGQKCYSRIANQVAKRGS
jgi:hypothetical protein